jgi:cyanophycinase
MTPQGTIIAIGGNEQKEFKRVDEKYHSDFGEGSILQNIISHAGGNSGRIEVITSASDIPEAVGDTYTKTFKELGAQNIGILDIRDRKTADKASVLKRIEQADCVMFSGGDQSQISRLIKDTKVHTLINERYMNEKFILAGTSAGAVVMSDEMIAGGKNKNTLRKNDLKMGKGLGLLPEVIFDSHFIRRWRFGRLAEAVAAHPAKLGIGLGEDTGLIITDGNCCEIIGTGMVILFDGSNFSHNRYQNLKDNVCISLANLTAHILAPQDKYYIREKRVEAHYNPDNQIKELSKFE